VDAGYNIISILSNSIYANGGLGIERAEAGVTPNDPRGTTSRPPNYPLLQASAVSIPLGTTVFGQLTQISPNPILVELFYSPSCDPSLHGEGATFLGSTLVTHPGVGVPFQITFRGLLLRGFFTATATTANGTSEFSACL
jgi:titin